MARGRGTRPEFGPEAVYIWNIGEALRDIRAAARREAIIPDGGRGYQRAVAEFLALTAPEIGYYDGSWREWQQKNLTRPDGSPMRRGDRLTKAHRRREVAHAIGILRKQGLLGWKKKPFSDDADMLRDLMDDGEDDEAG